MTEEERERIRAWEREVEAEVGAEGLEALAALSFSPPSSSSSYRRSLSHLSHLSSTSESPAPSLALRSPSLPLPLPEHAPAARHHHTPSSQKPYERRSLVAERGPRGEELAWGKDGGGVRSGHAGGGGGGGQREGGGERGEGGGERGRGEGEGARRRRGMVQDIRFEELALMQPAIASGTYKTVFKAVWKGTEVAALQVRQWWAGLEMEVELLRQFGRLRHPYLPAFHGVSQDADQRWYLVLEYFPLGGLDVQLEIWEGRLSLPVKLCVGQQICEAMIVIHQHGILHRDLATRNVLVYALDPESVADVWVKVTDFGLAREGPEYVNVSIEEDVPWRWTPPEVMRSKVWSARSDVWSFGVSLWEIFSDALIPYFEVNDDEELKRRIQANELRLASPAGCPRDVYAIMSWCWSHVPEERPSFEDLATELQKASSLSFQAAAQDDVRMASSWQQTQPGDVKEQGTARSTGNLITM